MQMAFMGGRVIGFTDISFSEPDQDANSALTELDKGLRSGRIGEQCETIVRFPRLFEKFPFPILINSACLKLAEVFRVGTNFQRMLVLKVMQQSEKHLDKILNIDEFVRRIFSVIYSNDPVARALTLRTLGSIAEIVSERKNLHHSIRSSLDSHDAVELDAAIYAAARFAAQSKTFAANICSRIGEMIQGLATPVDVKLKLLSVFQNMHHDAQTASQVRQLCVQLLPSYPAQQFVILTLHVLTRLAASCVADIPEQVKTLIKYMSEDPREGVKIEALQDLCYLAKERPHLWNTGDIEAVVEYALYTPYLNLKCGAMMVLVTLAKSVAVDKFDILTDEKVLHLCRESIFHSNVRLASCSIRLLTQLAIHAFKDDIIIEGMDLIQEVSSAIETLLLILCTQEKNKPEHIKALRVCLQCVILLCETNPDLCGQFVDVLGSFLSYWSGEAMISVCEGLCAIGSQRAGVLSRIEPRLRALLTQQAAEFNIHQLDQQALVLVWTMLLQAAVDNPKALSSFDIASGIFNCLDLWSVYRIARQAARYGHFGMAAPLFSLLCNKVSSEHFHFWLVSLSEVSSAENCLMIKNENNVEDCLQQALTHYMKAISALKAATTPTHTLQFQAEYTRLRSDMVRMHFQLIQACACLKTSPPPAIAASMATATRDELQKCGRVVTQLRKCSKDFRNLSDQYGTLYQTIFDADNDTLKNVQLLQQNCLLIAQAIDRVAQYNQGISASEEGVLWLEQTRPVLSNHLMLESCHKAMKLLQDLKNCSSLGPQQVKTVKDISHELVHVPLCLPRYFFQTLQSTSIKLAVSPQPKISAEPIFIQNNSQLAVKVEGVVQHGVQAMQFRTVAKVVLTVSTSLQTRPSSVPDTKPLGDAGTVLSQSVSPHNDYFQAQFLLSFPMAGVHTITIDTAVLDEQHSLWKTGPQASLLVKSHDDSSTSKAGPSPARSVFPPRMV